MTHRRPHSALPLDYLGSRVRASTAFAAGAQPTPAASVAEMKNVFRRAFALSMMLMLGASARAASPPLPRPAHVVIVVEENRSLAQVLDDPQARYIHDLFKRGALFTNAHGVTHPSLPNYLALFSGLTNDNRDGCPATGVPRDAPNLGSELLAAHLTFVGYSESLPEEGSTVCAAGRYGRKHVPWVHFSNVPSSLNKPFSAFPPYEKLPTVSFVIPDIIDDMHDSTIAVGDVWLKAHLGSLVDWAQKNDTLVILTWDEGLDDGNTIPTAFIGPMVRPGKYTERIDHYRVLRTIEAMYGLPPAGHTAAVEPITNCWR
jgi:acid phosphatase